MGSVQSYDPFKHSLLGVLEVSKREMEVWGSLELQMPLTGHPQTLSTPYYLPPLSPETLTKAGLAVSISPPPSECAHFPSQK